MKRFKAFKKLCSLALILSMLVSMIPINVFATTTKSPVIDLNQKGSLTINKYDSDYTPDNPETPENEEVKTPINGVEFTIYKIYDLVVENGVIKYTPVEGLESFLENENPELIAEKSEEDLKAFISSLKDEVENPDNNIEKTSVKTGANGTNGQAVFSNLELGYYLVDETAYPDQVVTPSDAFLVSIPMTNEAEDSWLYDVVANPKNDTALTEITLTKYGNNNEKLQGAKFLLQKKVDGKWEDLTELATNSDGILTVNSLTRGEYQFVETEAPDGYILDTTKTYKFEVVWNKEAKRLEYVYNGKQSTSLNIEVLNEKPTIEKVADKLTAGLGGKVRWTVTTTVPSTINKLQTFTITDTLSDGLEFPKNEANEVVLNLSIQQDAKPLDPSKYEVKVEGNKLTIEFKANKFTEKDLADIVVSYDTVINEAAVIFPSGNVNDAKLDYSVSTDSSSTDKGTVEDSDVVYSFGLQVNKTATDKTTPLSGAKFTLCKKGTTECHEGISGTNGIIKFPQLAAGEYVLTEVQAPNGYNLLKEPITIKITAHEEADGLIADAIAIVNGKEMALEPNNSSSYYYELNVVNNKGFTLPETGGMGTVIFTVVGLGMMGLAGAAYIALKRKESQQ